MIGQHRKERPLFVFLVLSGLFAVSMFYRNSPAVIAQDLAVDLQLDAQLLGLLGGAYFYCFVLLQLPLGPLLDRVGPRKVIAVFAFIGAAGALVFGLGRSYPAVFVGRTLVGIGMAAMLMGPLKVFDLRYPKGRFATLMGLTIAGGTVGTIAAATPLAYVTARVGWRLPFLVAAVLTAILGIAQFLALDDGSDRRDAPRTKDAEKADEIGVLDAFRRVLGTPTFWSLAGVGFTRLGTFSAMQGLWLGVYLMDVQGQSPVRAGLALVFLSIGYVLGNPAAGRLSDILRSRKWVGLAGTSLYALTLLPFTGFLEGKGPVWLFAVPFLMGFFCGFGNLTYSHLRELFPERISGTAMTLLNLFTIGGGAVLMPLIGTILHSYPHSGLSYPPEAYHVTFLVCFVTMGLALAVYAFSRE